MHPEYLARRRRARVIGFTLLALGVLGSLLPFIQGFVLILAGLTVLSPFVSFVKGIRTVFALAFPGVVTRLLRYETKLLNLLRLVPYKRTYATEKNRHGLDLSLILEPSEIGAGVAVLLHGASGTKDTHLLDTLAMRCQERGLSVVRFDASHGLGESAGTYAQFTPSNYLEDLEDVLAWVAEQEWYTGNLVLVGHSVGGTVASLFAADHPERVTELVLVAPTVSGARYEAACKRHDPDGFVRWREQGFRTVKDPQTGAKKELSFDFVRDLAHYDLVPIAEKLTMPVTILHGDNDRTTLREDVEALTEGLSHALVIPVQGMRHTPTTPREYHELREGLERWGANETQGE